MPRAHVNKLAPTCFDLPQRPNVARHAFSSPKKTLAWTTGDLHDSELRQAVHGGILRQSQGVMRTPSTTLTAQTEVPSYFGQGS